MTTERETEDGRWVEGDPLPFFEGAAVRAKRRVMGAASFLRYRMPDQLAMKAAWMLPRSVALWAYIRVMAHATQGPYGDQHVDDVRYSDAYKRWEDGPHEKDGLPSRIEVLRRFKPWIPRWLVEVVEHGPSSDVKVIRSWKDWVETFGDID
jgi:hypothetical protein